MKNSYDFSNGIRGKYFMTNSLQEKPCPYCGAERTGGDLARHKEDCSYVLELSKLPAVEELLKKSGTWRRTEARTNSKH